MTRQLAAEAVHGVQVAVPGAEVAAPAQSGTGDQPVEGCSCGDVRYVRRHDGSTAWQCFEGCGEVKRIVHASSVER